MKSKALLAMICIGASSAAVADSTQTVNTLNEASKIMDQCAAIANKIVALPVPAGSAEATAAEAYNEVIAKADAPATQTARAAPRPQPKDISPEQKAFMASIRSSRQELRQCGEQYVRVHKAADALMKQTGDAYEKNPPKTPSEDDKKVGAAMVAYGKSSEGLATAITALSKNRVDQRYVTHVVNKYFLERAE